MLMLMACRNIPYILAKSRLQDYTLQGKIGKELSRCTVGVIGTGKIGETVIRHLSSFGCRLLAYDLYQKESLKGMADYVTLTNDEDGVAHALYRFFPPPGGGAPHLVRSRIPG